jgi:hypothetical protein
MRILAAFLIAAWASSYAQSAQQTGGSIDPPAGARLVLQAKGDGVQIYTCADASNGFTWILKAPEAKLLDASGNTIGRHFAGPTWSLADGSQVQGKMIASQQAPDQISVSWLLLEARAGTGTGKFATAKFIRRTDTHGGLAPSSGCQSSSDTGKIVQMPYTATYSFYAER